MSSVEQVLTDFVEEEGISNMINDMKLSLEKPSLNKYEFVYMFMKNYIVNNIHDTTYKYFKHLIKNGKGNEYSLNSYESFYIGDFEKLKIVSKCPLHTYMNNVYRTQMSYLDDEDEYDDELETLLNEMAERVENEKIDEMTLDISRGLVLNDVMSAEHKMRYNQGEFSSAFLQKIEDVDIITNGNELIIEFIFDEE